jgi:hypothetical protein
MSGLRSTDVSEDENKTLDELENLGLVLARLRRERDERLAALRIRPAEEPVESDPGLKELVDTQGEFRERIMKRIERIVELAS